MYRAIRSTRLAATLLAISLTLLACRDNGGGAEDAFCTTMDQVATRMKPNSGSMTPAGIEARYDEIVTLLDRAEQSAPSELSGDVTAFGVAIDEYVTALAAVDFDLDAIFSTREGTQLAEDTSHALTPDVLKHMTGPCGISPE